MFEGNHRSTFSPVCIDREGNDADLRCTFEINHGAQAQTTTLGTEFSLSGLVWNKVLAQRDAPNYRRDKKLSIHTRHEFYGRFSYRNRDRTLFWAILRTLHPWWR
jgi:hypothetical protein